MAEISTDAFIDELQGEKLRLENAVEHLQRSIVELQQVIAEDGDPDREFKLAIEENIVVIAKYKARIERLDKEIANFKKGFQDLSGQVAIPASEAAPAAPSPPSAARPNICQQQRQQEDTAMADATNNTSDTTELDNNNGGMYL